MKIALDKHSIVVQRSGDIIIGVVVIKSHPVVKSLKRMIRRCFKQASPTKTEPEVASVVNDTAPVTPAVGALHPSLLKDEEPSGLPN